MEDPGFFEKFLTTILTLTTAVVVAGIHVLVVFKVPIDAAQEKALTGFVDAVGVLIIALVLYMRRTEDRQVVLKKRDGGPVVAGDAAPAPTGTPAPVVLDTSGSAVALVKLD